MEVHRLEVIYQDASLFDFDLTSEERDAKKELRGPKAALSRAFIHGAQSLDTKENCPAMKGPSSRCSTLRFIIWIRGERAMSVFSHERLSISKRSKRTSDCCVAANGFVS